MRCAELVWTPFLLIFWYFLTAQICPKIPNTNVSSEQTTVAKKKLIDVHRTFRNSDNMTRTVFRHWSGTDWCCSGLMVGTRGDQQTRAKASPRGWEGLLAYSKLKTTINYCRLYLILAVLSKTKSRNKEEK
jgi:hypothetical protein